MARQNANGEKNMDGVEKAAILLIALGPEKSAQIFKHLKEEEIEQLTLEIANTSSVSPQTKEQVLNDFYEVCLAQQYIAEGGIGYAKELLEKSLGEEKAKAVIGKLTASLQVRPFEFIRRTDSSQLLNFIQDEHPQTIALILSYLPSSSSWLYTTKLRWPMPSSYNIVAVSMALSSVSLTISTSSFFGIFIILLKFSLRMLRVSITIFLKEDV